MSLHMIEHIIAGLGVVSMLLHALELGCANAGWTRYQGIFNKIYAFVQGFMGGMKPPTAGTTAILLTMCLICPAIIKADTTPVVSITDALKAIPAIKSGVMIDFQHNRTLPFQAFEVFKYKGLSIDAGLVGVDGIAGAIDYNLGTIKPANMPILSVLDYCYVGYGMGYRTIALTGTDNPASDNQLIYGLTFFGKIKF